MKLCAVPQANYGEFTTIGSQVGLNAYRISVKDWVEAPTSVKPTMKQPNQLPEGLSLSPATAVGEPIAVQAPAFRRLGIHALTFAIVCPSLVAVGWCSGLRSFLHGALLLSLATAFFPFLLLAAAFGILFCFAFALSFMGAAIGLEVEDQGLAGLGEGVYKGISPIIKPYYGWLVKIVRGPVGMILGPIGAAIFILWAALGLYVVPLETKTTVLMDEIESQWKQTLAIPETPRDAFDQSLIIEAQQEKGVATIRIQSIGFDGALGTPDDLCLESRKPLSLFAKGRALLVKVIRPNAKDAAKKIRSYRCPS